MFQQEVHVSLLYAGTSMYIMIACETGSPTSKPPGFPITQAGITNACLKDLPPEVRHG